MSTMQRSLKVASEIGFNHGLGDTANFGRMIQLYQKKGHNLQIKTPPNRQWLLSSLGVEQTKAPQALHKWPYCLPHTVWEYNKGWTGNKSGRLISQPPLPYIGPAEDLWNEYCEQKFDVSVISEKVKSFIDSKLDDLPKPIFLLHAVGNTNQSKKSLTKDQQREFYLEFLDQSEGTLVLLDWDKRVPTLDHYRIRHMIDLFGGKLDIEQLTYLISQGILIGVDSGPLHLAQWLHSLSVGLWICSYCSSYTVPQKPVQRCLNIQFGKEQLGYNRWKRNEYGIIQQVDWNTKEVVKKCLSVISPHRYIPNANHRLILDIQLEQWVREFCNGKDKSDRHISFDLALRELTKRCFNPRIVETGCIRSPEDWAGAGFSTYLFAAYCSGIYGHLDSIDLDFKNCQFAEEYCYPFRKYCKLHTDTGVNWLKSSTEPINLLYLDSLDTYHKGHEENCLSELKASEHLLKPSSLVLIDDTPYDGKRFKGKGVLAMNYLIEKGWKPLYIGHQLLFEKS